MTGKLEPVPRVVGADEVDDCVVGVAEEEPEAPALEPEPGRWLRRG